MLRLPPQSEDNDSTESTHSDTRVSFNREKRIEQTYDNTIESVANLFQTANSDSENYLQDSEEKANGSLRATTTQYIKLDSLTESQLSQDSSITERLDDTEQTVMQSSSTDITSQSRDSVERGGNRFSETAQSGTDNRLNECVSEAQSDTNATSNDLSQEEILSDMYDVDFTNEYTYIDTVGVEDDSMPRMRQLSPYARRDSTDQLIREAITAYFEQSSLHCDSTSAITTSTSDSYDSDADSYTYSRVSSSLSDAQLEDLDNGEPRRTAPSKYDEQYKKVGVNPSGEAKVGRMTPEGNEIVTASEDELTLKPKG